MPSGLSEGILIERCRSAISKVDRQGIRGTEKVTYNEIEALVVALLLLGGPVFTSAANHKPKELK